MGIQRIDEDLEENIKALQKSLKKQGKDVSFRKASKIYAEATKDSTKIIKLNKKKKGRGKTKEIEITNLSDPFGLG